MLNRIRNERGFAIVYGLAVLLIATVGGTALLFMTQKDRAAVSDYSKMRITYAAAEAALRAVEGQFYKNPQTAFDILKGFKTNANCKWILNSSAAAATTEQKFKLFIGANSPQYSARIVSFDQDSSLAVIEGIGYGSTGEKKKAIGLYKLDGLAMVTVPGPFYGLYLGGNLENLNCPFNITGNVYFSLGGSTTEQHINGSSGGTITGNMKICYHATNILDMSGAITVTGNAFVLGKTWQKATLTVNGKAGFTNAFPTFTAAMNLKNDAFFLQSSDFGYANCVVGQASKTVKYKSTISSNRFTGFGTKTTTTMSTADLAAELGMSSTNENPYTVNTPWSSTMIKETGGQAQVTGSDLDNWWTTQKNAGKLFNNEWLILKTTSASVAMNGGTFTKKVIWLTNNFPINVNTNWPNCADTSNTMIYVTGASSYLTGMGVPASKKFRGFIYVDTDNAGNTYGFGSGAILYGAIQHKRGKFDINSGTLNIVCNEGSLGQTAIKELVDDGVLSAPAGSSSTPELTLVDTRIRPTLLSVQM